MKRKLIGLGLCALLFALSVSTQAQQPKKVPRIGYLSALDPATESSPCRGNAMGSARAGLHSKDRTSPSSTDMQEGKTPRFPDLAAELVRLKLDLIVMPEGNRLTEQPRTRPRRFPSS